MSNARAPPLFNLRHTFYREFILKPPDVGGFFHGRGFDPGETEEYMQFFASAITTLQTLVIALGAGLGVWGVVNLLEGYGSDNPGAKSQGMKQFMAN